MHPWQGQRIKEDNEILKQYGLKNKKEVWKAKSLLSKVTSQAKKLSAGRDEQAKKEAEQLLNRLVKYGLIKPGAGLGDVLGLKTEDILNRRLQTLVYKHGLARSAKQARQFVVHGHVIINNQMIDVPSYMVPVEEQGKIGFIENSSLSDLSHPERIEVKRDIAKKDEEKEVLGEKEGREKKERKPAKKGFKKREFKKDFGKKPVSKERNKGK